MIIFSLVWFLSKKITKLKFFKKNRNRFKLTGFGLVRFFRTKTGSNWFDSIFSVWIGFPVWISFSVWLSFSGLTWFFFVWFRFSFFGFRLIKPKPNQTEPIGFFKILIGFFHSSIFSVIFFRFSWFFSFFTHPLALWIVFIAFMHFF